jgi:RNA polymerase sigma-70 factor (ECF subfamily)
MMGLSILFGASALSTEPAQLRLPPALEAVMRGDAGAMRTLYAEHEVSVRSFARRLVGDADGAEDLVQEVFVALPEALRRFRGASSLRTFLLSMTAHRASHHVRSAARRRAAHDRFHREETNHPPLPDANLRRKELAAAL